MFPVLNGILFIFVYLAFNQFVVCSLQTHLIISVLLVIYFTLIYLSRYQPDLLKKMINNMKKVK